MTRRWTLVLLAAIALAAYANTLGHEFAFDDFWFIVDNPTIRSLDKASQFFASRPLGFYLFHYRPLTQLSFSLDFALAGLHPWLYHAENIVLHALVTLLVYLLLRPFGDEAALLAAAFFAVLPVHTEVVANVASRSELLAATLGLAALWQIERPLAAALLLLLALLAKETAVAVPALALLLWWRMPQRPSRRQMLLLLGALAVAVSAYLLLRYSAHRPVELPPGMLYELDNPLALADWATRLRTALMILGQNLALCFVPYHLSADYSYNQIPLITAWGEPRFLLWTALPVALLAGAAAVRRRRPNFLWGLIWFFVALAPVSNLLMPIGTIRAERLLYLPSVGICLVLGEALGILLAKRRRLAVALAALLLVTLGAVAARRNMVWQDQETLVRSTLADAPNSARAHHMFGTHRRGWYGDCATAAWAFQRALEILPQFWSARLALADCLEQLGDLAGAERQYRKLFVVIPDDRPLAQSITKLCALRNDWLCVATTLRQLLTNNLVVAAEAGSWVALGNAWLSAEHLDEAELAYRKAMLLGGTLVGRFNYAGLLVRRGRYREALEQYATAERMGMSRVELYEDWALAYRKAGDPRGARQIAARGLERFPNSEALKKAAR